ncbi:hypothetical protein LCGC14_1934190 [marine sediment metagenome]|uniref:Uncharacterized protein n=1 Tax=marine sediment metagenome TaxID=412755 RepID=A0A0F9FML0_9ZZZZ
MQNLIKQLAESYPDWRRYHKTPMEAAVEIGLLDEDDLAVEEMGGELNFNDE